MKKNHYLSRTLSTISILLKNTTYVTFIYKNETKDFSSICFRSYSSDICLLYLHNVWISVVHVWLFSAHTER